MSLLDMKVNLKHGSMHKATVWNDSEKLMFVKTHVLIKASVAILYSGFRRYFVKQREIGLFCLIADSRILQSCFC